MQNIQKYMTVTLSRNLHKKNTILRQMRFFNNGNSSLKPTLQMRNVTSDPRDIDFVDIL